MVVLQSSYRDNWELPGNCIHYAIKEPLRLYPESRDMATVKNRQTHLGKNQAKNDAGCERAPCE
jgi:hypothetical protein